MEHLYPTTHLSTKQEGTLLRHKVSETSEDADEELQGL
jgi:hypothetical protein